VTDEPTESAEADEATDSGAVATETEPMNAVERGIARELERAEQHLPAEMTHAAPGLLPGELRPHPTPVQYVIVAIVLVVITALEIAVSYTEGTIPDGLIVVLLLVMAFVKFFLVASWYMHLRTDQLVFRRFFILGAVAAILLYLIVLATLHGIA
jgi:cytochrome c oxidase subunit 4